MNHPFVSCMPGCEDLLIWQSFSRWWSVKNDDFIVLNDETVIYGVTNDFSQQFALNLCLIIAKYYITPTVLQETEKIATSKPSLHTLKTNYLSWGRVNGNQFANTTFSRSSTTRTRVCVFLFCSRACFSPSFFYTIFSLS